MTSASLTQRYFDDLYAAKPDPWDFAASAYEHDKYAASLAALPHRRYTAALEVGCSIGVMTSLLAERCDRLLAVDTAEAPLVAARRRCAPQPWVDFMQVTVPTAWPAGRFDLITLSEVLYYLSRRDVALLAGQVERGMEDGGNVLLVHWIGATNYPLSGDAAADAFIACASHFSRVVVARRTAQYRLDLLECRPLPSEPGQRGGGSVDLGR